MHPINNATQSFPALSCRVSHLHAYVSLRTSAFRKVMHAIPARLYFSQQTSRTGCFLTDSDVLHRNTDCTVAPPCSPRSPQADTMPLVYSSTWNPTTTRPPPSAPTRETTTTTTVKTLGIPHLRRPPARTAQNLRQPRKCPGSCLSMVICRCDRIRCNLGLTSPITSRIGIFVAL